MQKNEFRKICKSRLKSHATRAARCEHYVLLRRIEGLVKFLKARKILIFLPMSYEPNVLILRKKLSKSCEFYVPFMVDISLKMVRLRQPFKISRFGLRQTLPQNGYFKKVDLAVVPAIGVDGAMARIGHGKGFYDMFFSGLKLKPAIAFVSIKDCFCSEILSLDHDVKGDFYITPSQNYLKRGKYDRDFNRLVRSCGGRWHRILSS